MKKRRPLRNTLLALLVLLGCLAADSGLRPVTTRYELHFASLPPGFDGFCVVQLSDLHGAVFGRENARLLRAVAAAEPDLIALTGDLADRHSDLTDVDALLAALTELAPVYYVSGNHEWSEGLIEPLQLLFQKRGVRYLRNEYLPLERGGERIILAGVEDPNGRRDQPTPDAVAAKLRDSYPMQFVLMLGHRNDFTEKYPDLPVDLVLCGHAHGGVIRIPGLGGLLGTDRTLLPDYTAGLYPGEGYQMLVSRGLGNHLPVPRLGNNPEVVVVTLCCGA